MFSSATQPSNRIRLALSRLRRRRWVAGVASGIGCAIAAWLLCLSQSVQGLDDWLFDSCFIYRGARSTSIKTYIVGIDSATYRELNRPAIFISPELADAIAFLKAQGTAAIGVDLIIPEEMAGLAGLEEGGPGDATKMGTAVQKAGNVVLARWWNGAHDRPLETAPQWRWKHLSNPDAADACFDLGFVDTTPDGDQFVRRQVIALNDRNLHFAAALLERAKPNSIRLEGETLQVGGAPIPLDDSQLLRINFLGPPGTVQVVPLRDVLSAATKQRALDESIDFRDAVVVIGDVTRGQHDFHAVPYANRVLHRPNGLDLGLMSGPELHLNILV
jgi:CHASE2 domain-containing sensor protein